MTAGTLYLIPAPLGEGDITWTIPDAVRERVLALDCLIVEHPKTARKFLKQAGCERLQSVRMFVLDAHTPATELEKLLQPLAAGCDMGLLSEAGCPAVADPGTGFIGLAHKKGIRVVPLVGPSSLLLGLMASGLNGQRFAFHGYLPIDQNALAVKLVELEKESRTRDQTQIFIETPYRNQKLLSRIVSTCGDNTILSVSSGLTTVNEFISTKIVRDWRLDLPNLHGRPTVFLLHG